jgi:hypothetical protein
MKLSTCLVLAVVAAGCPKANNGTCTADEQCTASKCCQGKCVDVQTSASHCGACLAACSSQNGAAKCAAGVCAISCTSGFGDCDQLAKNGCETELASSVNHCGACGTACKSSHATSVCERSQCLQSSCLSGFGDCNASSTDGCEVDLKSTLAHCGSCGKKCEVLEGTGACSQSACTVASCNAGFGDCDSSAATGCETDLRTTDAHCGVCGMACATGYQCKVGRCVAPELLFYGGVVSIQSGFATNVVSSFNVDTHAWTTVAASGGGPGNRFAHLAVWDTAGKQMLVWGGYLSNNLPTDNSFWALDYGGEDAGPQPAWKKLVTTGTAPTSRGFMGAAWNKATRTLYVFGGTDANNNVVFDDFYEFDAATLKWTQRTEPGSPSGRFQAAMVWDSANQRLVLGEGTDDNFLPLTPWTAEAGARSSPPAFPPPVLRRCSWATRCRCTSTVAWTTWATSRPSCTASTRPMGARSGRGWHPPTR